MKKILCYSIAFLLLSDIAAAQELLLGLEENPLAQAQPKKTAVASFSIQYAPPLVSLPFVDDFAHRKPYPKTTLWESRGVYVNNTYALNMPTVGVATFDALNDQGRLYPHLTSGSSPADSLTSFPISLTGAPDVVLSFFYEPGGVGDMPGMQDFLNLEFYSPITSEWTLVWSAFANEEMNTVTETNWETGLSLDHVSDTLNNKFIYTAIAIDNPDYLHDGFRFRFINYVTLSVNQDAPGRASNADMWHLDFVYLDRNRNVNDTNLPDVAMSEPQAPISRTYESIPASHLNTTEARRNMFGNTMTLGMTYHNLGWGVRNVTRRFSITPLSPGITTLPENYLAGSENIFDGQIQSRSYDYDPYEFMAGGDSAVYEIKSYLIVDSDMTPLRTALRENDTTSHIHVFRDYYAYDDGTAENGYGLYGNRTESGRVAVQYSIYSSDSLRGVYMYFNMAKDTANARAFRLAVWADNNGMPGELIYSHRVSRPAFRDSMNMFVAYKLEKPLYIARNQRFYVGWIQQTEGFLNIGYDANRTYEGKNFYSLSSTAQWMASDFQGALMIRPIFCKVENFPGDYVSPPVVSPAPAEGDGIKLYPNPVRDLLYVRNADEEARGIQPPVRRVEIYDMKGNLVQWSYANDGSVSVSSLLPGIYIVRIMQSGAVKAVRKIIVSR